MSRNWLSRISLVMILVGSVFPLAGCTVPRDASSVCAARDRDTLLRIGEQVREVVGHGSVSFVDDCTLGMRGSANWTFVKSELNHVQQQLGDEFGCRDYEPKYSEEDETYMKCVIDKETISVALSPSNGEMGITFASAGPE